MQAWKQSTTLLQAEVLWRRRTTLIETIRPPPCPLEYLLAFQVPEESRCYLAQPDRLVETDSSVVMWDTTIPTARKVKANRPDIMRQVPVFLLVSAVVLMTATLRSWQSMQGDLWVEISRLWQCRTHVVPVVLGPRAQCTQVLHG